MRQFKLKSFDETEIFVTIWDDVSAPCGVVQLLHGMSEYAGRYDEFARYMNSRGYIVFADDHRAHGRTETDENRGRHKGDIFNKTLKDELFFREWLKKEYDLPVFVLGHSYGSFLAQAIAESGTDVKAIALTGSGYMRGLFSLGTALVAPIQLFARNWRPNLGKNVDWVNSLPERVQAIKEDKYANSPMSVNFCYSMLKGTAKLYSRKALSKLNPTTSIALFSGAEDRIGQNGRSVRKLHKVYCSYGINCELHLFEGARHDIIYEHCSEKVQREIADFFDKFIIYEQTSIDDLLPDDGEENKRV